MASYFGEVLPVFSRAVDAFEDDEDCINHIECTVYWSDQVGDNTLDCCTFIIASGPTASAFADTHLLGEESECIGVISTDSDSRFTEQLPRCPDSTIHRLRRETGTVVCKTKREVLPEQAFGVVSQILKRIPVTATCAVLSTHPAVDYKGDSSSPVLRALVTSKYTSTVPCSFIETPNIISGLPAQVLSHCEVEGRPTAAFVLYMENIYFDTAYINKYKQCFTSGPLSQCSLISSPGSDAVQKKADAYAQSHNIYI